MGSRNQTRQAADLAPGSVLILMVFTFYIGFRIGQGMSGSDPDACLHPHVFDEATEDTVVPRIKNANGDSPVVSVGLPPAEAHTQAIRTKPPSAFAPFNKIPNILWFSFKFDLLNRSNYDSWLPAQQRLADNVLRIVKMHPNTRVEFLDDLGCERAVATLSRFSPTDIGILLRGFQNEKDGSMKGDVCRGAALLSSGGYYFDIDLYPLVDVRTVLTQFTEFVSCYCARRKVGSEPSQEVFQAFIGSEPQHPIIREYLNKILIHYSQDSPKGAMGVVAMARALRGYKASKKSSNIYMLQEENLKFMASPLLKTPVGDAAAVAKLGRDAPRIGGAGGFCDFVVYDPKTVQLVFYSRVPGASKMCYDRNKHFLAGTNDTISIKG